MSYKPNTELRTLLRARAVELMATHTIGDPPVPKQLVQEFKAHFEGKSDNAIYQMVCYYLREKNNKQVRGDARRVYTNSQMGQLIAMSPKERQAYADRTGRSIRAINAALERYRAKGESNAKAPIAVKFANERILKQDYFDFSSSVDHKVMKIGIYDVVNARKMLADPYGLSLRCPNILYHAPTKRRYYMSTAEQLALLSNPIKFIRSRADHIKDRWVATPVDNPVDPVDDVVENPYPDRKNCYAGRYDGYPLTADGAVDTTGPRMRKSKTHRMVQALLERLDNEKLLGPTQGSELEEALQNLIVVLQTYLGRATKPFDPKDPSTYVDDTNTPLPQNPSTPNQNPDDYSDVDDWAADWKPVSGGEA